MRRNSETWRPKAHHVTPKGTEVGQSAKKTPNQRDQNSEGGYGPAPLGLRDWALFLYKWVFGLGNGTLCENVVFEAQ